MQTALWGGAVIGPSVRVWARCRIGATAVLSFALSPVVVFDIGAGSIIGELDPGFKMTTDSVIKMPHLGFIVVIRGPGIGRQQCAIDRGSLGNTQIGPGL